MKEAPNSPYAKLVFRETFNSEQSVRNNGGVPTAVTISKGVGSFNDTYSGIVYPKNFNGTYSIRIRFKEPTSFSSAQYLCDFRQGTGVGYVYCSGTSIFSPGGTKYANGAVSSSSIAVKEIVVSGMPITSTELTIGKRTAPFTSCFIGDLELFEIYQGTLTASEVKNLYDNDWNKDFISSNLLLDYDSTNGYITDRTGKNTLTATDVSIKKTGSYYSAEFNGTTSTLITNSIDPTILYDGFTLVAWVKVQGNPQQYKRIFDKSTTVTPDNGFYLSVRNINTFAVRVDPGGALSESAINVVKPYTWQFVSATITSSGRTSLYIGDLNTAPALSGTESQNGVPSGITTTNPITIGNRSTATDRGFMGMINFAKAYSGVLSLEDITQIWSSTRGKVN
jgi:hypothetical protein